MRVALVHILVACHLHVTRRGSGLFLCAIHSSFPHRVLFDQACRPLADRLPRNVDPEVTSSDRSPMMAGMPPVWRCVDHGDYLALARTDTNWTVFTHGSLQM